MSAADHLDDLTVCAICFEKFKIPKCLPCLHTFCKTCLENLILTSVEKAKAKVESSWKSGFPCPICRTVIDVPSTCKTEIEKMVDSLPTNYLMVSLIDIHDIKSKKVCLSCQRQGTEQIASSWCCHCTEPLCDTCVKYHKSSKFTTKHNIIQIENISNMSDDFAHQEELCEEHEGKKLEIFCYDHKQPCCITCITLKHRKCDHITTLEEAAGQVRAKPTTSELANSLQTLNQEFKDEITNCEVNRENWESQTTETRRQVKALKVAAIKHIEDLEERIQQEISLQEKICGTDLSEREEILKDRHTIVTQCLRSLDLSVKHANNVQLFLEINKIEPKITELKEFLAKAKSDTKTYQMTFEEDSTLKSLMQTGQFGKLSLSTEHLHKKRPDFKTAVPKLEHVIQRSGASFTHFVFVGDEHILVCDQRNNDVCLYTLTGKMETQLKVPGKPWGICVLSQSQAVITIMSPNSALFIDIDVNSKSLTQGQTIQMDDPPYVVTYSGECIIVSLPRKLHFMKTDGTLIQTISTNAQYIGDVQIYKETMLLYTDHYPDGYVYCITQDGTEVFRYKHQQLQCPLGICSDEDNNIYVTGYDSNNIHQLTEDGQLNRVLLTQADGIKYPFSAHIKCIMGKTYMAVTCENTIRVYTWE